MKTAGVELLAWVPAPADTPTAFLGLAQADRLRGIAPDSRHLGKAFGHFEATGVRPSFMQRLEQAGIRLPANLFAARILGR